ncbi:TPA: peptidase inhibitor family I36 protein [Yersinia enterocolitica]|nr:peptidase inhibitor family I36 protein [Yersinia enterocolitica]HDL7832027.1 peptidase inhibitor family I36 protein [Yersinia enterocolitica]HDL7872691.1 peptidase inhibitor family I36 protein [Yersinia enterocolitica]HDL7885534.1 peptidase inhibitor family I36 protein [Yersinia enterocolitica]HDL7894000.1 peptidase inhibitor family I36 protein [Yersinia enterocolitica]
MIKNKYYFISASLVLAFSFPVFSNEPKVCFFPDENFQGSPVCTIQGNAIEQLPAEWNDKISSIFIPHGMAVTVFKDEGFSGRSLTLKESVDSLSHPRLANLNNSISSFKVRSAACFYASDAFRGDSFCLSGNEQIDLYQSSDPAISQYKILNPLNDRISSIRIPLDIQVTIYQDDNYGGSYFVLRDDIFSDKLEKIGMYHSISSIKVAMQEEFLCDQHCVINGIYTIPLGSAFGEYWLDHRIKYREALVSLKLSDGDNYTVEFIDGVIIKVRGWVILLTHKDNPEDNLIFELSKHSDTLSFLSRLDGNYSEFQFIESKGSEVAYISPLIGSFFDFGFVDANLIINNLNSSSPLIIDKVVLTAEKVMGRTERSTIGIMSCWLIPIINIYNYVIQGKCNQADRFVKNVQDFFASNDNKILQISGSSDPLPKKNVEAVIQVDMLSENTPSQIDARLTHINIDLHGNSLVIPATALACNVSMKEQLLPNLRQRRNLPSGCIDWTLNILTDFTLLFGNSVATWNAENFGRVIERIMNNGDIGYAQTNIEVENRLIENVKAHLAEKEAHILHIKTAFDFAQLGYADYLLHYDTQIAVGSPLVAQGLPLGRYELALQSFQLTDTVPRIRRGGQWVEDPELHFEVEVIRGMTDDTALSLQRVLSVINEWRKIYHQTKTRAVVVPISDEGVNNPIGTDEKAITNSDNSETTMTTNNTAAIDDTVIGAARLVSDVAQSWLRTSRDEYIYVIVRLAGRVVSITMAVDINEYDSGIAGSLSHPDYVLRPEAEGTIRGAGTAAIKALANYLKKKGKRSLISDVISRPSAIVKERVGFKFAEEFER